MDLAPGAVYGRALPSTGALCPPAGRELHPGIRPTRPHTLFDDLKAHVASVGRPVQELYVPRANETPLPLIPSVLADGVAEEIEELYADDFAAFGDRWAREDSMRGVLTWSDDAIANAAFHSTVNERINDLSERAREFRSRWQNAKAENQRMRRELELLQAAEARRPVARVRRRAARVRGELAQRLHARGDEQ